MLFVVASRELFTLVAPFIPLRSTATSKPRIDRGKAGSIDRNNARNYVIQRDVAIACHRLPNRLELWTGDETLCRGDKPGSVVRLSSPRTREKAVQNGKSRASFRPDLFRSLLRERQRNFLSWRGNQARPNVGYRSGASSFVIFCSQRSRFKHRIVATLRSLHPRRK